MNLYLSEAISALYYGNPERDAEILADLSPHERARAAGITATLLGMVTGIQQPEPDIAYRLIAGAES